MTMVFANANAQTLETTYSIALREVMVNSINEILNTNLSINSVSVSNFQQNGQGTHVYLLFFYWFSWK